MKVSDLIKEIYNGSIVLPDFQRSFIWEPEDVRELIVSVLGDYFIGSMLLLECHKDQSPFALRFIEGVEQINREVKMQSIVKILLDGQQRSTALFYAVYQPSIPLKNRKSPYEFYLDIDKVLKKQCDNAVIAVSTRDKRKLSEIEKSKTIIPFSLFTDIGGLVKKFKDLQKIPEIIEQANYFLNREIHMVSLPRETNLEKIVETFERINRTGEPLSTFELLTAKLYKDKIKLRDLLETAKKDYNFTEFVPSEFILKVIALMRGKEPKRKGILELEPQNFTQDWEKACKALKDAYDRAVDIRNGYGVLDFKKWMPYTTMLVPLAGIINWIKTENLEELNNYKKIDQWYWAAVFSNRYDQAVDTTSYNDFKAMKEWLKDDNKVPDFIQKFNFNEVDLDVDKQSSAIYRAVINVIVLEGALDFKTGQPPQFGKEKIQDDHIFPKSVYEDDRLPNRTLISTNAEKSSKKPSEYFKQLLDKHRKETLIKILESHIIPSEALDDLLKDNKENFIEKRKGAIKNILKKRLNINDTT